MWRWWRKRVSKIVTDESTCVQTRVRVADGGSRQTGESVRTDDSGQMDKHKRKERKQANRYMMRERADKRSSKPASSKSHSTQYGRELPTKLRAGRAPGHSTVSHSEIMAQQVSRRGIMRERG